MSTVGFELKTIKIKTKTLHVTTELTEKLTNKKCKLTQLNNILLMSVMLKSVSLLVNCLGANPISAIVDKCLFSLLLAPK